MAKNILSYKAIKSFWENSGKKVNDKYTPLMAVMNANNKLLAEYRDLYEKRHFYRIANINKDSEILEMGCGAGRFALDIAKKSKYVEGVDFAQSLINIAQEDMKDKKIKNIKFYCEDITKYRTKRKFDVIYFASVFQYLEDRDVFKALNNCKSMLKSNGILVSRDSVCYSKTRYKKGKYEVKHRNVKEFIRLFEKSGFMLNYTRNSMFPNLFGAALVKLSNSKRLFWFFMKPFLFMEPILTRAWFLGDFQIFLLNLFKNKKIRFMCIINFLYFLKNPII